MTMPIQRPEPDEYAPYFGRYVSLVADGDILGILESQVSETCALLGGVTEERADYRYAEGKWSVRECLGHMIDTERIFAYRALRISRADETPLPGFDQDQFAANSPYGHCRMADLVEEFRLVRQTTLMMFRNLAPEAWTLVGTASDHRMSVRALAYCIAGHERHHQKLYRERYFATV